MSQRNSVQSVNVCNVSVDQFFLLKPLSCAKDLNASILSMYFENNQKLICAEKCRTDVYALN